MKMKATIKISVNGEVKDDIENMAKVLNAVSKVNRKQINDLAGKIKNEPDFLKNILNKLNNPLIKKFL